MALTKTQTTSHGFVAENSYLRVEGVRLETKNSLVFRVRSYKDESSVYHFADVEYSCAYDLEGKNPIAQAYEHLKTLSEFAEAQDC